MNQLSVCYLRDAASVYGVGLEYATSDAAGMDLRACMNGETLTVAPGDRVSIPTGICVEPHTAGVAGFVYSRSGLGAVKGLTVAQGVGVIDADYRGEVIVWLLNTSKEFRTITRGDRIAQLVFQPVCRMTWQTVDRLSDTERGSGGFGHTGNR